ncbi:hypothetical protein [Nocardioides conyzicola]|uniref:Uncharacterized protein n=1 Tax=Nocardioides conyzicola TaxID=1651781 RepID=A0ABP8WXI7_9ACTN
MELQPRDAPLPPFFAAVRRRHPDVDIVLLPPEQRAAEPVQQVEQATEQQLANAFDLATGIATKAWAEAVGDGQVPETRFAFGDDPTSVEARARLAGRLGESPLETLAAALTRDGWELAYRAGAVSQLIGRRATMHLRATYAAASGSFVLTATSTSLPVGADRARELARR